jgi:ribosomal protein S18 acetylase RimI-like enzyme
LIQAAAVRVGTLDDLQTVGLLWRKLNDYHLSIGMHFRVDDTSVETWLDSFTRTLGRFSFLWVTDQEGEISAFLLGRLKKTPAYLGGVMVGEISDLYVSDKLRGQGIGKQLVSTAMQHFKNQSIHSVEVQIMTQNVSGLAFWNSLGFQNDVILVRQMVEPGSGHA